MPFARIDALGAGDLFQVLASHDGTGSMLRYDPDYLGSHRDDGTCTSRSRCAPGRTPAQKSALYRRIPDSPAATRAPTRGTCSSH